MRTQLHIILILLASLLASCVRTNQADRVDITFVSSMQDEVKQTKAGGDSDPLYHDFWAWGYKTESSAVQTVIAGYKVSYAPGTAGTSEDNSHDYTYVGNTSLSGEDQTIKFWDFSASEYNFWGATLPIITPTNPWNADGTELTISGLNQSTTAPAVDDKLFSARLHREPVSSNVVRLEFLRPYTKVRVLFFTNAPLSDEKVDGEYFDNIQIRDITFGPENPDSDEEKNIITAGTLKVRYAKSGDAAQTYATERGSSTAKWSYNDITLDCEHGTASNNAVIGVPDEPNGEEYYYAIPNSYTTPFVMKATIDNEEKTAVVPQNFMLWKPNMVFTYLFKISGGNQIELYDVHIDAWKFGGSIEDEWKNW